MGLGNRTARRHQSLAVTASVDPSIYWDFQPGQRVMTVDGFPGTIASVEDGPLSGTETYIVTLANEMGGGEYTASQLRATSDATGSVHRTAAEDYPELGTILVDRPDIAPNTVMGSLRTVASGDEHWPENWTQCPRCYQMVDTDHTSMGDHLAEEHGLDDAGQERAWRNYHQGAKQATTDDLDYRDRVPAAPIGFVDCPVPGCRHLINTNESTVEQHLRWMHPDQQDEALRTASFEDDEDSGEPYCERCGDFGHDDTAHARSCALCGHDQVDGDHDYPNNEPCPYARQELPERDESNTDYSRFCGPNCHSGHDEDLSRGVGVHHTFHVDEPHEDDPRQSAPMTLGDASSPHAQSPNRQPSGYEVRNPDTEGRCHYCRKVLPHAQQINDLFAQGSQDTVSSNPHGIETFPGYEPNDGAESGVDEHGHLTWGGHSPGCRDTDEYSMFGQNDAVEKQAAVACNCGQGGHTDDQHAQWAEANGRDPWGRPVMQPYDGHGAWNCNNRSCAEHPQAMYEQRTPGMPGWLEHDTSPDADLRRQVNQAMPRQDTEDANWLLNQQHTGPSKYSSHPVEDTPCLARPGMVHRGEACGCFRGQGQGPEWSHPQQDYGFAGHHAAFNPWSMLTTASADPDFRFHVTASWSDVRAKAKRIRAEGGVHVTSASDGVMFAEVKGDHNVYESGLQRLPGKSAIQAWSCGCKWGAYHWGAGDDFSRFAGRMCSHALALQYEAQSRGMFGRDVTIDDAKPSWAPRKVVVKYDIDADRNRTAPATPVRGDYGRAASLSPAVALIRHALRSGEPLGEITLALHTAGVSLPNVQAAVNDAWGEPDPPARQVIPGPTKPTNPNDNPASSGWATHSDPDSWSFQGPIGGMNPTTSSFTDAKDRRTDVCATCGQDIHDAGGIDPNVPWVHAGTGNAYCDVQGTDDATMLAGSPLGRPEAEPIMHESSLEDEAMFEPEMGKEAFLPLLLEALPAIADAVGAGAAAEGAGAAAGAGAAGEAAGTGAGSVVKKVVPKLLEHHQNQQDQAQQPGSAPSAPSGPSGPSAPRDNNPLNYGASLADLHEQPEAALPSTDGDLADDAIDPYDLSSPDSLEPESSSFVSTGSVDDVVAQFQATAGARMLQGGSSGASNSDGMDIAAAAKEHLAKSALKDFTPAEQAQIINEGEHVRAANLDRLEIAGTHYEPLEAALAAAEDDDEGWMS